MHERLFLENKYSKSHAMWTLYRDTKAKADKEGRTPVIGLQEFRKKGILLVIHSDDLQRVAAEAVSAAPTPTTTAKQKRKLPLRKLS